LVPFTLDVVLHREALFDRLFEGRLSHNFRLALLMATSGLTLLVAAHWRRTVNPAKV
jgi:hypothetical protein